MEKEDKKTIILIMKLILERLMNMDKWGGAHSELGRVRKSLPSHLFGKKGKKLIDRAFKNLVNLRFLLVKPSTGELHISLNPSMKKEIDTFIEKFEREEYRERS